MTEPHNPNPDTPETKPGNPGSDQPEQKAETKPESGPAPAEEKKPETAITDKPAATAEQKKPETAITAKPAAAKPPAPKPAMKRPAKKGQDRRFFLFTWIGVAWTAFTLTMVGWTLGTIRFMFPNVLSEPPSSFKVGPISNFEENVVTDRFKEQGVWVVRSRQGDSQGRDIIYALSTICTHLGCTPNWLESDKKFKCPCHGSGFKISGINFEGPAPRPLERFAVARTEDNQIQVDKSKKFQQERGEWDDPSSYILV